MAADGELLKPIDPIDWYDANADETVLQYEGLPAAEAHAWLIDCLPARPALVLDVGAGSGRDAEWLASLGHQVVAVEPSDQMRARARQLHAKADIRWLKDRLPGLENVFRLGLTFDFILLNAVWMHVRPNERQRAFRKLVTLLKPGGFIALSFRSPDPNASRGMFPASTEEIERLARTHGAFVERSLAEGDRLGRPGVQWSRLIVRLPDDGTGALPLLRHIILHDAKSSTYKLALLRSLARIADSALGTVREVDDQTVAVPLGLVALYWIRQFKPLVAGDLPQMPKNRGVIGLGFAKGGFQALRISPLDLRIAARFAGQNALNLHQALRESCDTITTMPVHYTKFPAGGQVFQVEKKGTTRRFPTIVVDTDYLSSFGFLHIPRYLWSSLVRYSSWIEPALIAEWVRLMKAYAETQERKLNDAVLAHALVWSDPKRDVELAKRIAMDLLETDNLFCIWSSRRLSPATLDIDHCFPWSAWPCGDLWNLMPAHREVNSKKSDRLPSGETLKSAHERILNWWESGYSPNKNPATGDRFFSEAKSALPLVHSIDVPSFDDVFVGLEFQRLRLKHDQQIPEWSAQ
jgi:SAM-dependent methyltransferase